MRNPGVDGRDSVQRAFLKMRRADFGLAILGHQKFNLLPEKMLRQPVKKVQFGNTKGKDETSSVAIRGIRHKPENAKAKVHRGKSGDAWKSLQPGLLRLGQLRGIEHQP